MLLDMHHAENSASKFLFNQYFYLKEEGTIPITFVNSICQPSMRLTCVESNKDHYVSGYRAPFAGIELDTSIQLNPFIADMLLELKSRNARTIEIKQAPFFYQEKQSEEIHKALLNSGFSEINKDCSQYIKINPQVEFERLIDAQKRRRLKNAKKMGMNVQVVEHIDSKDWYQVYVDGRTEKGYPITISQEKYTALSTMRPNIYMYAGVFLNDILIASAIFVRVSTDVMYYFVAASSPQYAYLSPTVLLIEAMYLKGVSENFQYLDLGISSVSGELNQGLHAFKRHMGAQECAQHTYLYTF